LVQSVKEFKQDCEFLTAKFAKIDKRCNSQRTLHNNIATGNNRNHGAKWLPCCRPGVPCSSRAMAFIEPNSTDKGKKLIVACAEVKYCLRSTKV
jgi:hypothetical protein